jgi:hypothetical protein
VVNSGEQGVKREDLKKEYLWGMAYPYSPSSLPKITKYKYNTKDIYARERIPTNKVQDTAMKK